MYLIFRILFVYISSLNLLVIDFKLIFNSKTPG